MGGLGGPELLIVLVLVMVVFGAGKLPNVMKDLGRGVREFRDIEKDAKTATDEMKPRV